MHTKEVISIWCSPSGPQFFYFFPSFNSRYGFSCWSREFFPMVDSSFSNRKKCFVQFFFKSLPLFRQRQAKCVLSYSTSSNYIMHVCSNPYTLVSLVIFKDDSKHCTFESFLRISKFFFAKVPYHYGEITNTGLEHVDVNQS